MTEEERRALVIWQLREWSIDPTWVAHLVETISVTGLEEAIREHADRWPGNEIEKLFTKLKRPRVGDEPL
jgi:hypothetical protein